MVPLGHAGLTLATSLGALFNAATLYVLLRRRRHYAPAAGLGQFVAKVVVATGVLAGVLAMLAGPASTWLQAGLAERIGRLALVMAAGGAAYFGSLWLLGFRPKDFSRRDRGPAPRAGRRARRRAERRGQPPDLRCGQRGFVHSAYR